MFVPGCMWHVMHWLDGIEFVNRCRTGWPERSRGMVGSLLAEAPGLVQPGTSVEPFALRALGIARGADELLERADERFAALGLAWHRAQTERLRSGL